MLFQSLTPLLFMMSACADASSRYRGTLLDAGPRVVSSDTELRLGEKELDRSSLVASVLARNPGVAAARAAIRVALARYRQETSLDDPMIAYSIAPVSVVGDVTLGHSLRIEQKLPWFGKRALAGEAVLAEAEVMRAGLEEARQRLAELASKLFDDYYVVERALEINAAHRELLIQMRASAESQYAAGRASQQDPLQADVELARVDRERIAIETERATIVAELNGMLHREPTAPLPPPPRQLTDVAPDDAGPSALRDRPELHAQEARLRAGEVERRLAQRAYWPDISLMGEYNSMWDMSEHRWMIGLGIEVPLQRARRAAAVEEAEARIDRARDEKVALEDEIRVAVAQATARLAEARAVLELYRKRLVPTAEAQVQAARAGYIADRNEFQALIDAERGLRDIELERARAEADVHRRRAELDRASGRIAGGAR